MSADGTRYYEEQLTTLRERLIRILGVPTVNRLIERAVVEIGRAHPALQGLRCDGDRMVLDDVRAALEGADPATVRDTFTALNGVLLLLVARLLGREIAIRMTDGISVGEFLESRAIGE